MSCSRLSRIVLLLPTILRPAVLEYLGLHRVSAIDVGRFIREGMQRRQHVEQV